MRGEAEAVMGAAMATVMKLSVLASLVMGSLALCACNSESKRHAKFVESVEIASFGKSEQVAVWHRFSTGTMTAGTAGAVVGPVLGAWHSVPTDRGASRQRRTEWIAHARDAAGHFDPFGVLVLEHGHVLFSGRTICHEGQLPATEPFAEIAGGVAAAALAPSAGASPSASLYLYPVYLRYRNIEAGTVGTFWLAAAAPDPAGDPAGDRLVLVLLDGSGSYVGGWCDENRSRLVVTQVVDGVKIVRWLDEAMSYIEIIGNDLAGASIRPVAADPAVEALVNESIGAAAVVGFAP